MTHSQKAHPMYSREYFSLITFGEAETLKLPPVLSSGSMSSFGIVWASHPGKISIQPDDYILHLDDIARIMRSLEELAADDLERVRSDMAVAIGLDLHRNISNYSEKIKHSKLLVKVAMTGILGLSDEELKKLRGMRINTRASGFMKDVEMSALGAFAEECSLWEELLEMRSEYIYLDALKELSGSLDAGRPGIAPPFYLPLAITEAARHFSNHPQSEDFLQITSLRQTIAKAFKADLFSGFVLFHHSHGHYTTYTYNTSDGSLSLADSLAGEPDPTMLPAVRWILEGLGVALPTSINRLSVDIQPAGNQSCALASLNAAERIFYPSIPAWTSRHSYRHRLEWLVDAVQYIFASTEKEDTEDSSFWYGIDPKPDPMALGSDMAVAPWSDQFTEKITKRHPIYSVRRSSLVDITSLALNTPNQDPEKPEIGHLASRIGVLPHSPSPQTCPSEQGISSTYDPIGVKTETLPQSSITPAVACPILLRDRHPKSSQLADKPPHSIDHLDRPTTAACQVTSLTPNLTLDTKSNPLQEKSFPDTIFPYRPRANPPILKASPKMEHADIVDLTASPSPREKIYATPKPKSILRKRAPSIIDLSLDDSPDYKPLQSTAGSLDRSPSLIELSTDDESTSKTRLPHPKKYAAPSEVIDLTSSDGSPSSESSSEGEDRDATLYRSPKSPLKSPAHYRKRLHRKAQRAKPPVTFSFPTFTSVSDSESHCSDESLPSMIGLRRHTQPDNSETQPEFSSLQRPPVQTAGIPCSQVPKIETSHNNGPTALLPPIDIQHRPLPILFSTSTSRSDFVVPPIHDSAPQLLAFYNSLDEGVQDIQRAEALRGYSWVRGQSKRSGNSSTGPIKRLVVRCNAYGANTECHDVKIDPSDHRRGRTIRTGCPAR